MGSSFCISGRLYGNPKTNMLRGGPPAGGKAPRIGFSVGTYDSYRKEMCYFRCIAFGKVAERINKFYHAKRAITVYGRIDNTVYRRPGEEKDTRSVQFVVTNADFPENGDGVPTIKDVMEEMEKSAENISAGEAEAAEAGFTQSSTPEDPDDLPF